MSKDSKSAEAMISALKHKISLARDVLNNDAYYDRERLYLETTIAELQRRLEELNTLRTEGYDHIESWKEQIRALRSEATIHLNQHRIDQLRKAQEQLNAIQSRQS